MLIVKAGFDRGDPSACAANSLLFMVHSFTSKSSKCISTAQPRRICSFALIPWQMQ